MRLDSPNEIAPEFELRSGDVSEQEVVSIFSFGSQIGTHSEHRGVYFRNPRRSSEYAKGVKDSRRNGARDLRTIMQRSERLFSSFAVDHLVVHPAEDGVHNDQLAKLDACRWQQFKT
ncbi:hypothetical protein A5738_09985 [Mycobacterium colombiense]|nr:hypothetical protein A5738_09985 [Mycobacterium colombiense]